MLSLAGIEGVGRRTGNFGGIGDTGTGDMGIARVRLLTAEWTVEGIRKTTGRRTKRLDKRLGGSLVISRERRRAQAQCGLRQCCGKGEHGRLVTTEEQERRNRREKHLAGQGKERQLRSAKQKRERREGKEARQGRCREEGGRGQIVSFLFALCEPRSGGVELRLTGESGERGGQCRETGERL
ncbi:hypothetical protein ERJ75_001546600 [Trypanosoma vivax]|nr:hypothetical protein ERJ75_001546600 [Trypanosoma vivax]